ncbi:hypothetical protein F4778DRAFT_714080 [Xylariomycetidae sp. FL2044]|nr:hypothetical protein F4778DRAFT_714080 [Xylariomycetidae sp. FL2044]
MEYRRKQPENLSMLPRFGRWLRLKQYQIEVTFGVYMFTPTEKFAFWSVVFLLSALTIIAIVLYLPQHLVFIIHRAWFYVNGGGESSLAAAGAGSNVIAAKKDALSLSLSSIASTTAAAASETAEYLRRDREL